MQLGHDRHVPAVLLALNRHDLGRAYDVPALAVAQSAYLGKPDPAVDVVDFKAIDVRFTQAGRFSMALELRIAALLPEEAPVRNIEIVDRILKHVR